MNNTEIIVDVCFYIFVLSGFVYIAYDHYKRKIKPMSNVSHPSHYNHGKIEVIEFIEDQRLGFHLGNCVKYIARAGYKADFIEDLEKAKWYLDRYIQLLKQQP